MLSFLQERSKVARKIIDKVGKKRGKLVSQMSQLCEAYIAFAHMDASSHRHAKGEPTFVWSKSSCSFLRCVTLLSALITQHPSPPHLTPAEAIPIPADQLILKIKDLTEVTIPTMEIPVNTKNNLALLLKSAKVQL